MCSPAAVMQHGSTNPLALLPGASKIYCRASVFEKAVDILKTVSIEAKPKSKKFVERQVFPG
jgi:hypothetical protein